MSASKEDVVGTIGGALEELERLVSSAAESAWANPAYEGWNAKQLLCHIAATSNVAGFLLAMARNPGAHFGGGLDEDELLAAHYRAPWGYEGPLADVIVDSLQDHLMMHLRDLSRSVA